MEIDIELLRKAIVDGVLNGIDSETYDNIQRIAKKDAETEKNTNNRRGGVRLS